LGYTVWRAKRARPDVCDIRPDGGTGDQLARKTESAVTKVKIRSIRPGDGIFEKKTNRKGECYLSNPQQRKTRRKKPLRVSKTLRGGKRKAGGNNKTMQGGGHACHGTKLGSPRRIRTILDEHAKERNSSKRCRGMEEKYKNIKQGDKAKTALSENLR